jgi:hypothetical protein
VRIISILLALLSYQVFALDKLPLCTPLSTEQNVCVQLGELGGDVAWWLDHKHKPRTTLVAPDVSFWQIITLAISADAQYLAILSVGEGHPIIDVFALRPVLVGHPTAALWSINPYPGWIELLAWQDEMLHFSSDHAWQKADNSAYVATEKALKNPQNYLLDIRTGQLITQ